MATADLSPVFLPLFIVAFVTNMAYIGALFLLHARLRATAGRRGGYEPPPLFGGSAPDLLRFLGFVFSARHVDLDDGLTSRLVWVVRALLVVGLALTLSLFGYAVGLM